MGLLERMQQTRSQPQNAWPVGAGSVSPIESVWGHDDSMYSPAEYGEYIATSSHVYAAVSLRARLMSSLDLRLYRGRGPEKIEATAGPAVRLLQHVNPFWTWPRLARMDELSKGLWGESYWVIQRNSLGVPVEIWWVKPPRMTPVPDESGYLKGFLYEPATGGERIPFTPDEVIWFRYPNPLDEFSALSPLAAARLSADTGSAMMKSNRNLFVNGLGMGGVIVPDTNKVAFSSEQAQDLERDLERRFKGTDKRHRWAVLRYEAQFRPMDISPKDAEFVNGLNLTLRDVANAYGIPAPLLNDLEHATLANLREFQKALWEHALVPDAVFTAAEIEEQLLPMFGPAGRSGRPDHCEFDFTQVAALQESQSEAWDRERQAIEVGALTINEWRKRHGLPPVEWGDVYWAPVNKAPVADGETVPAGEQPDPDPDAEAMARLEGRFGDIQRQVDLLTLREPGTPVTVHVDAPVVPATVTKRVERDEHGRVVAVVES